MWEWYGDLEGKDPCTGSVPGPVLDALWTISTRRRQSPSCIELHSAGHWGGLRTALQFLGFSGERTNIERVRHGHTGDHLTVAVAEDAFVEKLVSARNSARAAKNFKEADRIRDELAAMGIALKDAKDPKTGELVTTWEVAR